VCPGEALADGAGARRRLVHRHGAERDERHHVEGADAPVHAVMPAHVHAREDDGRQRQRCRLDGIGRTEESEDGAMMIGIGVHVGKPDPTDAANRVGQLVQDPLIASLAHVRHALEDGPSHRAMIPRASGVRVG